MTTPAAAGSRTRAAETTASVFLCVVLFVYAYGVAVGLSITLQPARPSAHAVEQVMINAPGGVQAGRDIHVATWRCATADCAVPMYPWKGQWVTGPELVQLVDEDAHKDARKENP